MIKNNHISFLLCNNVDKNKFIETLILTNKLDQLDLKNLKGILFSDITINKLIEEEDKHDTINVPTKNNRKFRSLSSGEQKKAFLQYCLAQNFEYIILDNPFDHLDKNYRIELSQILSSIANSVLLIQLTNREDEILPFISKRLLIKDNTLTIEKLENTPIKKLQTINLPIPNTYQLFDYKFNNILKFDNVSVSYGAQQIINNISWTVKKGDFWHLTGPNGSGKSTLLSLINGDNPKAYGQNIYLFNKKKGSGESVWEIKKRIGYFSTSMTELFARNHTLEQMILAGFFDSIGLYQKPTNLQQKIVEQWIAIIDLSAFKKTPFIKLTISQQRIALIVRAIVKNPLLLILDEPFEGLDDENLALVTTIINAVIAKTKITTIYVSHRTDPRITPTAIFELTPSKTGSTGKITNII
ncbi:ATP-binding cassette domain-containing protein [Lutibacter sp. HS1-25]|uniref:ATP-binding cassette domain-containing protein n=1 Tax=Lutibacter sp. HS1-25 TaxID=2485000 RepID=UPI001010C7C7|nr:ATP-binding cassette domain-containing protein [Lutibacter sp. HS1-25]RXP57615.1 ATP-binding cassette domain-containing protein [Lutibacter sp. HS1-25]